MWDAVWNAISIVVATVTATVLSVFLVRRLNRRDQERARIALQEEDGIPLLILKVCYEHAKKTGAHMTDREAQETAGLSDHDFGYGLGELNSWGAVEVDFT